jgi:hypothetical protein
MNERKTRREIEERDDDDDAPVRKKKKKKKKPQAASKWPIYAAYGGFGVVMLILIIVAIWVVVSLVGGGPPAEPVTAWEKFRVGENEISFEYPKGWRVADYGKQGTREVDIVEIKGNTGAKINFKENLVGSLIGDIANAGNAGKPVPDHLTPVARVHEMRFPKEMSNYKEEPAMTVQCGFGDARRSAYTQGSQRGYRVTILMHQTALDVYCWCRASDWDTLRPAFERFITSLGR